MPLVIIVTPFWIDVATPPTAEQVPDVHWIVVPSAFITPNVAEGDPLAFATAATLAPAKVPVTVTFDAWIVNPVLAAPAVKVPTVAMSVPINLDAAILPARSALVTSPVAVNDPVTVNPAMVGLVSTTNFVPVPV